MSTTVQDYSEYLHKLTDAKKRKSKAALQAAYENSLASVDAAAAGLEGEYRRAKNDAAAQSAREERQFHEYAAAHGLNSGTAGQAKLARSLTLQSDLNALDRDERAAQAGLEGERAAGRREYEAGLAAAEAEAEADLAESLYQEQVRREKAAYQAARDAEEDRQWQAELDFAIRKYWNDKGVTVTSAPAGTTGSSGGKTTSGGSAAASTAAATGGATVQQLAREVIAGKWGNGADRRARLTAAGYDYAAVQSLVDALLG